MRDHGGFERYGKPSACESAPADKMIGIVGCSAEGAALCYRTICAEGREPARSARASGNLDAHALVRAPLRTARTRRLGRRRRINARFREPPRANGLRLPHLPRQYNPSSLAADGDVYPHKLAQHGIEFERPTLEERREINRIIMDELVYGVFKPESIACFQRTIERMKKTGCDAVVLGCTETLTVNDSNSPLPTLDSTRLIARAALRHAVTGNALSKGTHV